MNDNELRARLHRLREPAVDKDAAEHALEQSLAALGEAIELPSCLPIRDVQTHGTRRKWQEWLWPSPFAWGALAVIWIGIITSEKLSTPTASNRRSLARASSSKSEPGPHRPLLAHHGYRELLREYQKLSKVQ